MGHFMGWMTRGLETLPAKGLAIFHLLLTKNLASYQLTVN